MVYYSNKAQVFFTVYNYEEGSFFYPPLLKFVLRIFCVQTSPAAFFSPQTLSILKFTDNPLGTVRTAATYLSHHNHTSIRNSQSAFLLSEFPLSDG